MTEGSPPQPSRPSLAYLAGMLVRNAFKLPEVVRAAALEGWNLAGARGSAGGRVDDEERGPSGEPGERVMLSSRAMLLVERAQQLASEGREDAEAVHDLTATGQEDGFALRAAATWFQESEWNLESRDADRAYRLLTAAIRHDAVRPASRASEDRFGRLEQLLAASPVDAWEQLCSLETRLRAIADDARAGRLGPAIALGTDRASPDEVTAGNWLAAEGRLRDRLQPLVGPSSRAQDWLVRTAVAYRIAADYLRSLRPG